MPCRVRNHTITYIDRTDPVAVRLDGLGFDGFPGEGEEVKDDIENIIVGANHGDVLTCSSASNDIRGLGGTELIDGGHAADTLDAGPGLDTVTYLDRTTDLAVSLDDVANDGATGELDNVAADFENITGGPVATRWSVTLAATSWRASRVATYSGVSAVTISSTVASVPTP